MLAYDSLSRPIFFTVVEGDTMFIAADTLNMWMMHDTIKWRFYKDDQGLS